MVEASHDGFAAGRGDRLDDARIVRRHQTGPTSAATARRQTWTIMGAP